METTTTSIHNNSINRSNREPAELVIFRKIFQVLNSVSPMLSTQLASWLFLSPRRLQATPFPDELINTSSEHYIPFSGKRLKVYSWGFHGPKVLLVHGWESQSSTYRSMIPVLLNQGFSVIAFDAPGHGQSGGRKITMPRYASAIKAVYDHYRDDEQSIQYVVGHSFGGITSAWASAHYDIPLQKLVMVSMPSDIERMVNDYCKTLSISKKVENRMIKKLEKLTNKTLPEYSLLNFKDKIQTNEVLVVHDVQDNKVPYAHFEQLNSQWVGPKYITTSSLGHSRTIKDPEIIGQISNFLTS